MISVIDHSSSVPCGPRDARRTIGSEVDTHSPIGCVSLSLCAHSNDGTRHLMTLCIKVRNV